TGKVQIAIQDRLEIKRLITGAAKTVAARLQHFAVDVRRGGNNSHLVAWTKCPRLDSRIVRSKNHLDSILTAYVKSRLGDPQSKMLTDTHRMLPTYRHGSAAPSDLSRCVSGPHAQIQIRASIERRRGEGN